MDEFIQLTLIDGRHVFVSYLDIRLVVDTEFGSDVTYSCDQILHVKEKIEDIARIVADRKNEIRYREVLY